MGIRLSIHLLKDVLVASCMNKAAIDMCAGFHVHRVFSSLGWIAMSTFLDYMVNT